MSKATEAAAVGADEARDPPWLGAAVTVPASSANLGPGFDALAVAIDLQLTVECVAAGPERVVTAGEGFGELATGEDNLIWEAFTAGCARGGVVVPDVSLHTASGIPLERGLGSSSAAAVAGLALAREVGARLTDADLVEMAAALEGHPDNAAAAVHGGLVVCHDGRVRRLDPTTALRPVLCIPPSRQATVDARDLLPQSVPLAVAARTSARAAAVTAGLAGLTDWDPAAMVDELHEPPRFAAMSASGALVGALRTAGIGACLSGAGPTVLAIVSSGEAAAVEEVQMLVGTDWQVRAARWNRAGAQALR